jgi:hypothetical protein
MTVRQTEVGKWERARQGPGQGANQRAPDPSHSVDARDRAEAIALASRTARSRAGEGRAVRGTAERSRACATLARRSRERGSKVQRCGAGRSPRRQRWPKQQGSRVAKGKNRRLRSTVLVFQADSTPCAASKRRHGATCDEKHGVQNHQYREHPARPCACVHAAGTSGSACPPQPPCASRAGRAVVLHTGACAVRGMRCATDPGRVALPSPQCPSGRRGEKCRLPYRSGSRGGNACIRGRALLSERPLATQRWMADSG